MKIRGHAAHHRSVLYRTLRIVESANVLFLIVTLLVLGLFILGNYQEFMDRSQILLLRMVFFVGLVCVATGVFYLISLVAWMIRRRRVLFFRFLYGLLSTIVGAVSTVGIGVLQAVVRTA